MNAGIFNQSIKSIKSIERTQLMVAASVIIAATGFKYVIRDFEEHCDVHFDSRFMKSMTVFSLIFINTKNITISVFFTIIYNIIHLALIGTEKACDKKVVDEEL